MSILTRKRIACFRIRYPGTHCGRLWTVYLNEEGKAKGPETGTGIELSENIKESTQYTQGAARIITHLIWRPLANVW